MYGIEPEVTARYRQRELQHWAATRSMLARKPRKETYEVPAPSWSIRRQLGAALAALGRKGAGRAPRRDHAQQPSA